MSAVSVIVPVYNTEKYLEECIRSLTEQTLFSLELIFVDDGSTDASPKILERYRARDPEHIRVITQKNAGQGKARNVGLAAATGEYVGFVDSDDYVDRRMYAAMYTRAGSEDWIWWNVIFIIWRKTAERSALTVRRLPGTS